MSTHPRPDYAPILIGGNSDAGDVDRDGATAAAGSFLHLVLPAPRLPQRASAARVSGLVSLVWHLAIVTTLIVGARLATAPEASAPVNTSRPTATQPVQIPRIVFLQKPGPSGGGGGGGNRQSAPPSRAHAIGRDRQTLPIAKPIIVSEQPADVNRPPQQVVLDGIPLASGTAFQAGLPDAQPSPGFSQGPGSGGGVGTGIGTGIGSGTGPGWGSGSGGGFGGGAYQLGSGVVPPALLRQVRPKYTSEALMQKIQGTVVLEVVVGREGRPVRMRVTRSLDPGLDEEAITAVREWLFKPGRIGDMPVDVLVSVWVDFRIN
ncbi:MAG TPA: energy transducer TonB [Vicinamibacterales bacterium]|jgi:TonB family protein